MTSVTSADGTTIAYTRQGEGPALVLVDGALCHRSFGPNESLADELKKHFTVYTYDRRGRGDSGDNPAYEVEKEIQDLGAVIEAAGGTAHVYGISSGGALALEAAAKRLPGIDKLALFELPYVVDGARPPIPADIADRTRDLAAAGKRGAAVALFMRRGVNLPGFVVTMMKLMPAWRALKSVAHTLPYDLTIVDPANNGAGKPLPEGRWQDVTVATLVIGGGKSPQPMQTAMRELAGAVPGAVHRTLDGQTHLVKAAALAPMLTEFYTG